MLLLGALGENLFLVSSSFWWLQHSLTCGHITPISASVVILLASSVYEISLYLPLKRPLWLHIGPILIIQDNLPIKILNLITPAKTFFPYKVAFAGSKELETDNWVVIIQPTIDIKCFFKKAETLTSQPLCQIPTSMRLYTKPISRIWI